MKDAVVVMSFPVSLENTEDKEEAIRKVTEYIKTFGLTTSEIDGIRIEGKDY